MADPAWQPPSRREAMQVVSSLNRLRQYLPYLLGQRLQQAAAVAESTPSPTTAKIPSGNIRPRDQALSSSRRVMQVTPAIPLVSKPVVNTRPPPPGGSAVLVRPVISLNKHKDPVNK